ncbi:MAG: hypothetical protein ACRCX2_39120 [Paraclostridium sp.]
MDIRNWKELESLKLENENWIVEVRTKEESGYIRSKTDRTNKVYLSTHLFYKGSSEEYTKRFKERGFNVNIIGY